MISRILVITCEIWPEEESESHKGSNTMGEQMLY